MKNTLLMLTAGLLANARTALGILVALMIPSFCSAQVMMGDTKLVDKNVNTVSIVGQAELKNVQALSMSITGPLEFKKIKITGPAMVTGPVKGEKGEVGDLSVSGTLDLEDSSCATLKVVGPAELKRVEVKGLSDITGPLKAKKSKLGDLVITTDQFKLDDSMTGKIFVRKNPPGTQQQVLELEGDTVINGTIEFEAGKGVIKKGKNVKITGAIAGAIVQ